MEIVSKNRAWLAILPTMRNWIISPQIEKVESFLTQFKKLNMVQKITAIWQMMQPEHFFMEFETMEIAAMHQCIKDSPQLSLTRETMRNEEIFTLRGRYGDIKRDIKDIFEDFENVMTYFLAEEVLIQLIQSSPSEIMEEVWFHYNYVLARTNFRYTTNDISQGFMILPEALSFEERLTLTSSLRVNGDIITQRLLDIHMMLMDYIIECRMDQIKELLIDVDHHLAFLQKRLGKKP